MKTHTRTALGLASGLLAMAVGYSPATLAQAAEIGGSLARDVDRTEEWMFTVGAGAGYAPDYEGGDDYEFIPIPIARAQKGHRFGELLGLHVTSNLLDSNRWSLGPSYNFRQGYNNIDNERVDALTDRGNSHELGLKGGYQFSFKKERSLDLAFEVLGDVSSGHEGFLFTPSVVFAMPFFTRWELGLGADVTYASGNYMSHFFSVNAEDSARSGLKNYDADADFKDAAAHVSLTYEWSKKWHIHAFAEYKRMLGDAEDSPVVDDEGEENQGFGAIGITYTW